MPLSKHSTPLYAAVELGSDSFRLHVASWENGALVVAASLNEPIRLGAGIGPDGCLDGQTVRRALACLNQFKLALAVWEVRAVRVVATAALRVACDAPAFLPAAESAIGHPVEVLGAEEEGRLVYLGVAGALGDPQERRLVLDVGSGSTGIALGCGDTVERVQSYGVGALRQGLAFFRDGITPAAFEAALASSRSRCADAALLAGATGWRRAYGASGTVRALFELAGAQAGGTPEGRPEGRAGASAAGLLALRHSLVEEGGFMQIAALSNAPGRAAQMAGGLALLLALVELLGVEELVPVGAGLRAGVIRELARQAGQPAAMRAPYPECA
jgi:exopolyphosphatase/guanosine-5'-triphosphate,3'-diphosphate pyrophosphatase